MLTSDQAIVQYDYASGRVVPDRLSRRTDAHYLHYACRMLQVYREGAGRTRRELHHQVENILAAEDDCPRRRIAAFCKLLDEGSTYHRDPHRAAARLRRQVFSLAAPHHPLVSRPEGIFSTSEADVKAKIAAELGRSWQEIDADLFSDVIEFQRLRSCDGYENPEALLARYNVAQTQAALYRAESMVLWAAADYKSVLRYAKLARLMHSLRRQADGTFCFRFDGPASLLRRSTRYGVAMARFLPGLLSCRHWRAQAKIRDRRGHPLRLELSADDGLRSPTAVPEDFDSDLEADFAARWGDEPRDGWRLLREEDILCHGQTVFTPDFTLQHTDGRRFLLEIIGYWTPEYLQSKQRMLETFRDAPLLLAVAERTSEQLPPLDPPPVVFKTRLKPAQVLEWLANR